jgi:hypothetical protein
MDIIPFSLFMAKLISLLIKGSYVPVLYKSDLEVVEIMRPSKKKSPKPTDWTYGGLAIEYSNGSYLIYMNKDTCDRWKQKHTWAIWCIFLHELAHTCSRASTEAHRGKEHGPEWAKAYIGLTRRAEGLFWFLGY